MISSPLMVSSYERKLPDYQGYIDRYARQLPPPIEEAP